jgi:hypothetical protein
MGRLFLLLIVAMGLAPGTWWRAANGGRDLDNRQILLIEPLRFPHDGLGEVEIAGAWQLDSPNRHFSGYSSLLMTGDGTLLALTDSGRMMRFAPPGTAPPAAKFDYFASREEGDKRLFDLEAATRDPASGQIWTAYENTGQIERYDPHLVRTGHVRPPQMQGWPSNAGPEAIVRLADGRLVVLSESSPDWFAADWPALLFPGDPVDGAEPAPFQFRPPEGYRPVDAALLPDGRVLILLRRIVLGLPPGFEAKLVLADPAEIRRSGRWSGREIAHLAEPVPMDNYEGLAVGPGEDGQLVLWLISDDNRATFQRTLLLKLLWRPNRKARGTSRAPS